VALGSADDGIVGAKRELRRAVLAQRDELSPDTRLHLSRRISERLSTLERYQRANCVLAYCSFGSEFLTRDFIDATLSAGKRLILPKVDRQLHCLQLFYVESIAQQLTPGIWGILEPDPQRCETASPQAVEWILVPGVAFDVACQRLGYGGGYYDRLLNSIPSIAPRIAAAFSMQIVPNVPTAMHDQPLHCVITEDVVLQRSIATAPK
jgi:5-formyltetrahydrofolate cyclo-ligase